MFGQQHDQSQDDNHIPDQSIDAAMTGAGPSDQQDQTMTSAPDPSTIQPTDQSWQQPSAPADFPSQGAGGSTSSPNLASDFNPSSSTSTDSDADGNNLLDIKQKALSQLTPLVGHLEQSPEEKFRTTMMLIQASDNQSLIKTAYDASQAITDEKVRAQALLDIVNEINYFTQNQDS